MILSASVLHSVASRGSSTRGAVPLYVQNSVIAERRRSPLPITEVCSVQVVDCTVMNLPQPKRVAIHVKLENREERMTRGYVRLHVADRASGRVLKSMRVMVTLAALESCEVRCQMQVEDAEIWSMENQVLYTLNASWHTQNALHPVEARKVDFAFYEFPVEGTGRDRMFRRNNRGARLGAALPWGFWGLEGLRPIAELRRVRV